MRAGATGPARVASYELMQRFARDPLLALCAVATILFLILFIVYPQVKVVIAPALQGYQTFFASGPNWLRATQNSLTVMLLSTTSAVILGFVYAYAMVLSQM